MFLVKVTDFKSFKILDYYFIVYKSALVGV